jgi:hypothetical protein
MLSKTCSNHGLQDWCRKDRPSNELAIVREQIDPSRPVRCLVSAGIREAVTQRSVERWSLGVERTERLPHGLCGDVAEGQVAPQLEPHRLGRERSGVWLSAQS